MAHVVRPSSLCRRQSFNQFDCRPHRRHDVSVTFDEPEKNRSALHWSAGLIANQILKNVPNHEPRVL